MDDSSIYRNYMVRIRFEKPMRLVGSHESADSTPPVIDLVLIQYKVSEGPSHGLVADRALPRLRVLGWGFGCGRVIDGLRVCGLDRILLR